MEHDRLMIDVVSILIMVSRMELNDAFVIPVLWNDTFLKHAGAHNRLVIEMALIDVFLIQKPLMIHFISMQ